MARYDNDDKDPRSKATASIWGIAVGMMGICIPLVAITDAGGKGLILPTFVLAAAAVSTVVIWFAPARRNALSGDQAQEIDMMKQTIFDLHEHVDTLDRKVEDYALQARINQASISTNSSGASVAANAVNPVRFEPPPIVTSRKDNPSTNS